MEVAETRSMLDNCMGGSMFWLVLGVLAVTCLEGVRQCTNQRIAELFTPLSEVFFTTLAPGYRCRQIKVWSLTHAVSFSRFQAVGSGFFFEVDG